MAKKNSFIPQEVQPQIDKFRESISKLNEDLTTHFQKLSEVHTQLSISGKGYKELSELIGRYTKVRTEVSKTFDEQKRLIDEQIKLEQKLAASQTEEHKNNTQRKVDLQAIAREQKLVATSVSAYATELQKLYAMQELASQSAAKYLKTLGAESREYKEAIKSAKDYAAQINKLEIESGKLIGKTTSMYGATFQLTQVMRELPNFAISSRIGFMSLSNNIPMLIDSFKLLSQQINEITGKPHGFRGAMKIFAGSLLSLNTVLVVASTLLILYGDKIVELFTGKVPAAQKAHDDFIKSLKDGNSEYTTAIAEVAKLKAIFSNVDGTYITAKDALDKYNESIGKNIGETDDFNIANQNLINKTPAYVETMLLMAQANALLNIAIKEAGEAEELRQNKTVTGLQKAWFAIKALTSNESLTGSAQDRARIIASLSDIEGSVISNRMGEAEEKTKSAESAFESYFEKWEEMAKFAKDNKIDLIPSSDKDGSMRQARDLFIELKIYDKARAALIEEMFHLEEEMSRTTTEGIRNDFKARERAAVRYFALSKNLIESDYENAIMSAEQKRDKDLDRINDLIEQNTKYYKKGKISEKDFNEAIEELERQRLRVHENYNTEEVKANDEKNQKILENERRLRRGIYEIRQEAIEEEINQLKIQSNDKDRLIRQETAKLKLEAEKWSSLELIASAFGYEKDSRSDQLTLQHEENMKKLENEKWFIEEQMSLYKDGTDEKIKLAEQLAEKEKDIDDEKKDYLQKSEELFQERMQALKKKFYAETANFVNAMLDASYERERERNEQWKDERSRSIESQLQSEVITKEQADAQKMVLEKDAHSKELQLRQKQAKAERNQSLFSIAISTATAIMKAASSMPPPLNVPLIAMMAALGAMQAATVLAKPIPEYAFGTDDHAGGYALVGEVRGQREKVIEPSGKTWIADKPQIVDLPKHTKVIPDIDNRDRWIMEIAAYGQISREKNIVVVNKYENLERMTSETNKLIKRSNQILSKTVRSTRERGKRTYINQN